MPKKQPQTNEEVNLETMPEALPEVEEVNLSNQQEEILPQQEELTQEEATSGTSSNIYTEEEFYEVFKSVFKFGSDTFNSPSLAITADDELGARATANRIYKEAEKYKFLNFIIERDSGKVGEAILIISFLIKKVNGVANDKKISNIWGRLWKNLTKIVSRRKTVKESVSLERPEPAKQEKPENYLKPADAS